MLKQLFKDVPFLSNIPNNLRPQFINMMSACTVEQSETFMTPDDPEIHMYLVVSGHMVGSRLKEDFDAIRSSLQINKFKDQIHEMKKERAASASRTAQVTTMPTTDLATPVEDANPEDIFKNRSAKHYFTGASFGDYSTLTGKDSGIPRYFTACEKTLLLVIDHHKC